MKQCLKVLMTGAGKRERFGFFWIACIGNRRRSWTCIMYIHVAAAR